MAEEDERTETGESTGSSGRSAARTALAAATIGAVAAGAAVGVRKLYAARRQDESADGDRAAAAGDEDLASVLRKTALDVALAAASAATGYLSSDDEHDGEDDAED